MKRAFLAGVVAAIGLVAAACPSVAGAAPRINHSVQQSLPSTRLEFGLSNTDVMWMTSSGVPWRYRFTYLSGGVNTPNNWLTWQDPTLPPGQYALDYMTASTASPAAYIPVFTWYQLLQSTPSVGSSELDRDYSNLNNASTMSSYYASFKVLMQKAAQYGGQVIVHVEPDFWGYMQQKAAGGSASSISAMVKSSGFPEASGFADNLVGFASELKYLRDTYAPNALLAMHASTWSSGIDLASSTDPSLDPVAAGDATSAFLNSAGAGAWDAVFNDVDDHNAAWWELASCSTPPCVNQSFTHWWDPSNQRYPDFNRYLAWVAELHSKTSLPQVVWQVPMGNQYFLTMNNTCGHYQDNVAPYFIAHPADLFNAGLVAVIFGPGNSCQTTNEDSQNDGVTNNNGSPTSDLLGGCSACNTNVSSWADDDGGYLRIFVGRYYQGQASCFGASLRASPASPQASGTQITLTATASGCPNPLYQFWTLAPGASSWQIVQSYSSVATFGWITTGLASGTYGVGVWVRDSSSSGIYANANGRWDSYSFGQYSLTPASVAACSSAGLSALPTNQATVGSTVTFTATSTGCTSPQYEYWIQQPGGSYVLARAYGGAMLGWNTNGAPVGTYRIIVWARQAGSSTPYETYALMSYTLSNDCVSAGVSADKASPQARGTTVTFTATTSCANPEYEYWFKLPSGTYALAHTYDGAVLVWNTTGAPAGTYQIVVWVRDIGSSASYGTYAVISYTLT